MKKIKYHDENSAIHEALDILRAARHDLNVTGAGGNPIEYVEALYNISRAMDHLEIASEATGYLMGLHVPFRIRAVLEDGLADLAGVSAMDRLRDVVAIVEPGEHD